MLKPPCALLTPNGPQCGALTASSLKPRHPPPRGSAPRRRTPLWSSRGHSSDSPTYFALRSPRGGVGGGGADALVLMALIRPMAGATVC